MANPIYKFELTATHGTSVVTKAVQPVYGNDVTFDWQLGQNEQYYRESLSAKLTFVSGDFDFIATANIETEFELRLFISYNEGASFTQYWKGRFWKTDCEFDADNRNLTVSPETYDDYNDVLAGIDKEYDLISLAPEINRIDIDKRPMIQVYSPGDSVIGCFLPGLYWEQDCTAEEDTSVLTQTGNNKPNFALMGGLRKIVLSAGPNQTISPDVSGIYAGSYTSDGQAYQYSGTTYTYRHVVISNRIERWQIVRISDNVVLWQYEYSGETPPVEPASVVLSPVGGGASGTVVASASIKKIYSRYVLDASKLTKGAVSYDSYLLSPDDIVGDNRNYSRVVANNGIGGGLEFNTRLSNIPTQYGIYVPGQYYMKPISANQDYYPIARSTWDEVSVWFYFQTSDWSVEESGRKSYVLRDAYPIASVISTLLGQFAPDVKHEATTAYSRFLYGSEDPLQNRTFSLFITPKSNILAGSYDQPAQNAPITLRMVTDMLRDCFRCYWFIDTDANGDRIFRIEHIKYFQNGGSYSSSPVVGTDLTAAISRNGKAWAFGTSKYSYDKIQMPQRYQFEWMDDCSELFNGKPIEITSKFVQEGNIEQISVSNFTSDVDYMLLNPGACDDSGFALLAAVPYNATNFDAGYVEVEIGTYGHTKNILNNATFIDLTVMAYYDNSSGITVISFLDSSDERISDLGWFAPTQSAASFHFSAVIPSGAVKIGFKQLTRLGDCNVKVIASLAGYRLPYATDIIDNIKHVIQNPFVSFYYLQTYYLYDMPATSINAVCKNGASAALGLKKQKGQQVQFPAFTNPNFYQLVKTNIGNGQIEKISINLSSRSAKTTLRYDTE